MRKRKDREHIDAAIDCVQPGHTLKSLYFDHLLQSIDDTAY